MAKKDTAGPQPGEKGAPPVAVPEHRRNSRDVIYEAMMRGGSAFGAPFRQGVATLTERVVQKFKQRSFFGFETLERTANGVPGALDGNSPDNLDDKPNKFTRYGAARFRGPYRKPTR